MRRAWPRDRSATRDADMVHVGLMGARPVKYMRKLRNSPAFVEVVSEVVEDVVRHEFINLWQCGGVPCGASVGCALGAAVRHELRVAGHAFR